MILEGIPSVGPCTYTRKKPEKGYEDLFLVTKSVKYLVHYNPLKKWMSTA